MAILFFFFNDTATTEIYTLSLHDALPISRNRRATIPGASPLPPLRRAPPVPPGVRYRDERSEEHTSELQSRLHLVCRLLLEKKKSQCPNLTLQCYHCHSSHSPTLPCV